MSRQLWVSSITGRRRRGTRLAELRSIVGAGITAQTILEELQSCPADGQALEMATELKLLGFDIAGVKVTESDPVIGAVDRSALVSGTVRDHMRALTSSDLVSEATPLPSLLTSLGTRTHRFVLVGSDVRGIVTRADLNKPPVKVYLFGLVSLLEMHLNYWVRDRNPGESWRRHLDQGRLRKAEQLHNERRVRNQETDLFGCLQLCDKREIVLHDEELLSLLKLGEAELAADRLKRAEDLRNNLAHSQVELSLGTTWNDTIELVDWMEAWIHESDEVIGRGAMGRETSTLS